MDNYESFKKKTGIEISREDFEAGVSFMNGKWEGHPALITALREHAWAVAAPYFKRAIERQIIQNHNADKTEGQDI